MDLEELVDGLESAGDVRGELRLVAEEIGNALPRMGAVQIRRLRSRLAGIPLKGEARVYATAVDDLCAAFERAVAPSERDQALAAEIVGRAPLREVLLALADGAAHRPSDVAAAVGRDAGEVTRVLQLLREERLVETRTGMDRRARPQALTAKGRDVAEQVGELCRAVEQGLAHRP